MRAALPNFIHHGMIFVPAVRPQPVPDLDVTLPGSQRTQNLPQLCSWYICRPQLGSHLSGLVPASCTAATSGLATCQA